MHCDEVSARRQQSRAALSTTAHLLLWTISTSLCKRAIFQSLAMKSLYLPFGDDRPWKHFPLNLFPGETTVREKKGGGGQGGGIKEAFIWRFIFVNILHLCSPIDGLAKNVYMRMEFSHMRHFNILQNEDDAACISSLIWWAVMPNKSTLKKKKKTIYFSSVYISKYGWSLPPSLYIYRFFFLLAAAAFSISQQLFNRERILTSCTSACAAAKLIDLHHHAHLPFEPH